MTISHAFKVLPFLFVKISSLYGLLRYAHSMQCDICPMDIVHSIN